MSWTFEQLQRSPVGASTVSVEFDGRDVWALDSNGTVYFISYWDETTDYEHLSASNYQNRNVHVQNPYGNLALGETCYQLIKWFDHMYAVTATGFKKISIATKTLISTETFPETMLLSGCAANGKLWFTTTAVGFADRQKMYYYDIDTDTWSSAIELLGKKQLTKNRSLADGLDGHLYVTSHNDHSILKFTTAGSYVSTHVINRHPYKLTVNQDQLVYVVSDAGALASQGMISTFNQTSNVVTSFSGACGSGAEVFDDTVNNKMWITGGDAKLARIDKTSKDMKFVVTAGNTTEDDAWYPGAPGSTILLDEYPTITSSTITHGLVTPSFTYEKWNGSSFDTITVRPYLFFSAGSNVYGARLASLVRLNSKQVLGTAMVGNDLQGFYGD